MLLINCEINLTLTLSANCVATNGAGATTFVITGKKTLVINTSSNFIKPR